LILDESLEVARGEARASQKKWLGIVQVDLSEDRIECCLIEALQGLVVIIRACSLLRQIGLDPLPQDALVIGDETDVGHTLLHDNRPQLCLCLLVDGLFQCIQRYAIPALCLLERKVALQLQIESVKAAQLDMLVLLGNSARYMELCRLRVEVELRDANREDGVYSLVRTAARAGFGDNFTYRRGAQEIGGSDQVVGVPLWCISAGCEPTCGGRTKTDTLTMSSGSSGKSVALPEPSLRSMFCLMSRMLYALHHV